MSLALNNIKNHIIDVFNAIGYEQNDCVADHFVRQGWLDLVWSSPLFRQARLNVIQTPSLYMIHCCIFPNINNPGPIFGFDVFAGTQKITGFFHDFSPTIDSNHSMIEWFGQAVNQLSWNKPRTLPDWALRIFSPYIVAAGNIQSSQEFSQLTQLTIPNLDYYINHIASYAMLNTDSTSAQDMYCQQQRANPHNIPVLVSLGLTRDQAQEYVDFRLFPTIE